MSTLFLVAALLAAGPGGSYAPRADMSAEKPVAAPRTGRDLEQAVHAALRHWAKPADTETASAAREFLMLYNDLNRDTALSQTTRDQLASKLRPRLASLAKRISSYADPKAKEQPPGEPRRSADRKKHSDILAQQAGGPGPAGGMGGQGAGGQGFGPRPADDYGEDLVELIQCTIAPRTWERNGGPSSIRYWCPGRAIVVSAPDDVHERIGGLFDQNR